ncbi:TIM barrel protein [Candidatus Woesearchaeota archaeon]|jgi:hypothetical protein|nr:TIM barrel protein [Candidatus Woesearchaeota archaeon]MBT5397139.1 TIM barrel protein [Candidatus Woesearchaeota archaeon]MBT5924477.1 TIM barrel protein [Candidatus Woesearchaeota archaeon]MBT6367315.1 TIM barrel protein [Candidatus Woesearchaeota archaeon]MBT7762539.1 TIM barrel protein [Candidatus Woesearchaeota archaeon]
MVATNMANDVVLTQSDDELILRLGFPILPGIRNTLFPDNYLLPNNMVLEDILADRFDDSELRGMTLELHYQTLSDFNELSMAEKIIIRKDVEKLRVKGYNFMIHHPFLHQRGSERYDMNFVLHTIPSEFDLGSIGAQEFEDGFSEKFLKYCAFLEIQNVTIHATKPRLSFDKREFEDYSSKIGKVADIARRLGVTIAIETGGITREQLVSLHSTHGTYINLDTAHLFLDLDTSSPGEFYQENRQAVVDFFRNRRKIIPQLHLTETHEEDQHLPIYERGILGQCNRGILQIMNEDLHLKDHKRYLAMVESRYVPEDAEYVKEALSRPRVISL